MEKHKIKVKSDMCNQTENGLKPIPMKRKKAQSNDYLRLATKR